MSESEGSENEENKPTKTAGTSFTWLPFKRSQIRPDIKNNELSGVLPRKAEIRRMKIPVSFKSSNEFSCRSKTKLR